MERVIMLKWFKKLTERLFGDEEEIEEVETKNIDPTHDETEENRPTFRFPIITDAEIYGWDEEENDEHFVQEERPIMNDVADDFEPTPLYQNERWPTEKEPVIIHRASPSFKSERVKEERPVHRNEKSEAIITELETIQKRRRMDRFTPSQVPSPIYGYKMPERKRKEEIEQSTENDLSMFKEPLDEEKLKDEASGKTESYEVITEEQETEVIVPQANAVQEDQEPDEKMQHVEYNEEDLPKDREEHLASREVAAEATDFVDEPVIDQPTDAPQPVLEEVLPPPEEETQVEESEELPEAEEELSEEQEPELGVVDESDAPYEEVSETQPSEEQEVFQERIVPFNVLMLKSDKRKLKALEIADEMKRKEELIHQDEEPEIIEETPPNPVEQERPIQEVEGKQEEPKQEIIAEEPPLEHYVLPTIDYLMPPENHIDDTEWLASQSEKLEESLSHFGVQANVIDAVQGPTVTRFELTVGQGTKVSRVRNLTDDLKLTLAARDIRMQAPIPGKSSIGIEIPNRNARPVRISEVIQTEAFQKSESPLEAVLGLGLTGEPVTLDLRKMPHGMIAGATGSGKSVCINSILVSLLYKASPADLKMMLIDPKMVELAPFNGIPHLISPVITDVKAATAALKWAVAEMERRYELLAHAGVRDIERYNKQAVEHKQYSLKMPYLLIVIDELADLMMMAPADVEVSISRIAQKARACGIHLIIATQRPSVDVITGIIKANIPTRIAFSVSSQVDSRTMIDTNGAERLLGRGDMLYVGSGESIPVRLQGTFVTDDEIERIIEHVQNEASPTYLFGQDELLKSAVEEEEDPLFIEACQFIFAQDSASTSMLQRNFSIGYNRAAKLMDRLENLGFISPQQGSRARDVYLTQEELTELQDAVL